MEMTPAFVLNAIRAAFGYACPCMQEGELHVLLHCSLLLALGAEWARTAVTAREYQNLRICGKQPACHLEQGHFAGYGWVT